MASLITEKTGDELHEDALTEDIRRTEAIEDVNNRLAEIGKTAKKAEAEKPLIEKDQTLRIDLPVDQLLNASRTEKKLFFSQLIKEIKANIEMIRIERRLEQ